MKPEIIIAPLVGIGLLAGALFTVNSEVDAAQVRLETGLTDVDEELTVPVADDAEEPYCTPDFKKVLQRVLNACGLASSGRRGCQPDEVQRLAELSDEDFNALFTPLKDRGGVILFDDGSHELDDDGKALVEKLWANRKGARYFFVVARASKTGTKKFNQALSHKRANSVKFHIEDKFKEKDLDKKVGLLWLGYDYAQLGTEYCKWNISRKDGSCDEQAINRSAFVSWVDCRL
jgi:outer membrane protein OmpA-like peptidoglycan-associated protein